MNPQPSTSAAGTSKGAATGDHDGATSTGGVQEAVASPSGSPPVRPQQQLSLNLRVSVEQCRQLFSATCHVKIRRCVVPTPAALEINATPSFASISPADSGTSAVAKAESGTGNRSSFEEDDDLKVLATFPPKAPSTKKRAVTKKTGKGASQRKSSVHCRVCGKWMQKYYLKVHMRKHTGNGRYSCETCGRSFWCFSALSSHKKTRDQRNGVCPKENKKHDGGWRPKGSWKCKICGKRMKYSSSYMPHMRSHRGEKPFKCEECGTAFGRRTHLSKHKRIHTQVWQYNCVFCERGFHQQCNLFKHLRGHTEEKPYFCVVDGCGMCFRFSDNLKYHRRMIH